MKSAEGAKEVYQNKRVKKKIKQKWPMKIGKNELDLKLIIAPVKKMISGNCF